MNGFSSLLCVSEPDNMLVGIWGFPAKQITSQSIQPQTNENQLSSYSHPSLANYILFLNCPSMPALFSWTESKRFSFLVFAKQNKVMSTMLKNTLFLTQFVGIALSLWCYSIIVIGISSANIKLYATRLSRKEWNEDVKATVDVETWKYIRNKTGLVYTTRLGLQLFLTCAGDVPLKIHFTEEGVSLITQHNHIVDGNSYVLKAEQIYNLVLCLLYRQDWQVQFNLIPVN
jgi:hypothetical protein